MGELNIGVQLHPTNDLQLVKRAEKLLNLVKYMDEQNNDKNKEGTYFRVEPEEDWRRVLSLTTYQLLQSSLLLLQKVEEAARKRNRNAPFNSWLKPGQRNKRNTPLYWFIH
ncbi:hypothetical protein CTI12_AA493720 [Artemisia annua]|uniref:Uncharacterized protein n=1 Tax=Artemisia annua TaxID=35608 RepID=A0A2U1LG15_ARTAN|nr:hypothetical protein CTI12_AA493720 [Artemisia annua]